MRFFEDVESTTGVHWYPVPNDRPCLPVVSFVAHEPWQDDNGPRSNMYAGQFPFQQGEQFVGKYGGATPRHRPLSQFTGHFCGTAEQWLGRMRADRPEDLGDEACCGGPPVFEAHGGFEAGSGGIWPQRSPDYLREFYSSIFYGNTTYLGRGDFQGGLCLPINHVCGPLPFDPGECAYIEYNTCEGAIRVWDPVTHQLLCQPMTLCSILPDGIDTGIGSDDGGTCACEECAAGASSAWTLPIQAVDDQAYAGLVGRWKLSYTSDCTWVATDVDGNSWTYVLASGVATLTGRTFSGDEVVYDVSFECCGPTSGGLASSSTGNLTVPQTVFLTPLGTCPDCPDDVPPPDGPGICDCLGCPDGAPRRWTFGVTGMAGVYSTLNGAVWYIDWAGNSGAGGIDCRWQSGQTYPYWQLIRVPSKHGWYLQGWASATVIAEYRIAEDDFDCCGENVMLSNMDSGAPIGFQPSVTLRVPTDTSCDCGGGGSTDVACYPEPVSNQLVASVLTPGGGTEGDYPLVHQGVGGLWNYISAAPFGSCAPLSIPTEQISLFCNYGTGIWELAVHATLDPTIYNPTFVSSSGPIFLTFEHIDLSACGGSGDATIVVMPRP